MVNSADLWGACVGRTYGDICEELFIMFARVDGDLDSFVPVLTLAENGKGKKQ